MGPGSMVTVAGVGYTSWGAGAHTRSAPTVSSASMSASKVRG